MKTIQKFTFSIVFSVITLGCVVGFSASNGDFSPVDADTESKAADTQEKAAPAKPIDPPKTQPVAEAPLPKQISMADAVIIAERTGKGYTTKAERAERPTVTFTFEIMTRQGTKTRVILAGDGKVKSTQLNPTDLTPTKSTKIGAGKKGTGKRPSERERERQ